jgi:threonine dehydrogenase-like Zn-dependent dehydrogenase
MDKVIFLNGPKVRLELTPDDWNLNTVDDPELEQERDMIADLLNQDMADLIAECPGRNPMARSTGHLGSVPQLGYLICFGQ